MYLPGLIKPSTDGLHLCNTKLTRMLFPENTYVSTSCIIRYVLAKKIMQRSPKSKQLFKKMYFIILTYFNVLILDTKNVTI